jgi:hypothetical protein
MVYLYSFAFAIVMNVVFLPFWYLREPDLVPIVEAFMNIFILPVFLAILNAKYFREGKIKNFLILYFIVPISCLIGQLCGYVNWGISTGNLWHPDGETIGLVMFFSAVAAGASLLIVAVTHVTLKIHQAGISTGRKILAWIGALALIGVAAFAFGMIVYNIF